MKRFLAFDLGAESGRGVVASFDGTRLSLEEAGRFATRMGDADLGPDGVRRWDIERIWSEMQSILNSSGRLDGVGVDSWGVDFGLLGGDGTFLETPVQYRDDSHARAMEDVLSRVPAEEIWKRTGIQFLPFNTIYQLAARFERDYFLLNMAQFLLMMPDLMHYRLTGGAAIGVEATNASTTQLLNPLTRTWCTDLLFRLGLPDHFLGPIVEAGTRLGETRNGVPVYAPATHDTASAVVAVPARAGRRWAFLSSGTWSLLGVERSSPLITDEALRAGFSNEGGVNSTTRFLTNIMGLWLVQECRRALARSGSDYSYSELTAMAAAAPSDGPLVDATSVAFLAPPDMPEAIRDACRRTAQAPPEGVGPLIRCCLESLALAYRRKLKALEVLQGYRFDVLHIVGGGCNNRLLNQWTADACEIPVVAGPSEATAVGNALAQMVGAGVLDGWPAARTVSRDSFAPELYEPEPEASARWAERDANLSR